MPADKVEDRLLRVLIVDDHRATADTLSTLVGIWGHEVRRAYDGVTGLALAAAFRPDVLLLDILMPDVSGFEVAMQVRRQSRFKHCFLIAVTGRTDENTSLPVLRGRCRPVSNQAGRSVDYANAADVGIATRSIATTTKPRFSAKRGRAGSANGFTPLATVVQ